MFDCSDTQPPQLCILDTATDQITPLTHDLEFESIFSAAWSPDGQQLVLDGNCSFSDQPTFCDHQFSGDTRPENTAAESTKGKIALHTLVIPPRSGAGIFHPREA